MRPHLRMARLVTSLSLSLLVGCLALADSPERWPCTSNDDCEGSEICESSASSSDSGDVCFNPASPCASDVDCPRSYLCDPDAQRCRKRCSAGATCAAGEACVHEVCFEHQCDEAHPEVCNGKKCEQSACIGPCPQWGCNEGWTCTSTPDGPRCIQ